MRGSDYHFVAWGIAGSVPIAGVFSIDINRRAGHARLRSSQLITGRYSFGRVAAVTVLAASVALVTPATAAPASCNGIGFTVLHNDQSGGVILPGGSYTVS